MVGIPEKAKFLVTMVVVCVFIDISKTIGHIQAFRTSDNCNTIGGVPFLSVKTGELWL